MHNEIIPAAFFLANLVVHFGIGQAGLVFCLGKWHFRWVRVHYAFYEAVKRLRTVSRAAVKEGTHKRGMSFPNWIDNDDDLRLSHSGVLCRLTDFRLVI